VRCDIEEEPRQGLVADPLTGDLYAWGVVSLGWLRILVGCAFLKWAFAKSFSMRLARTRRGVSYFATSQTGGFSPVRFFKMQESLEGFSALPGESRVGELFKRKQSRHGMEPAVP
jgi:hypothetical protein